MKSKKVHWLFFHIVGVFIFALFPLVTSAQFALPPGFEEPLSVSMSPQTPEPGEQVQIKVSNNIIDMKRSTFVWTINGSVVLEGAGENELTFTAPQANQRQTISVNITKPDGKTVTKTYILEVADVDLIFEGKTYVPPFYKGLSLFTHQSQVTVTAVPFFNTDPSNLIYTWKLNGSVQNEQSGQGKQSITLTGSIVSQPLDISVIVESPFNQSRGQASLLINPVETNLTIYENNTIYGSLFNRAIKNTFTLEREEVTLTAIPYFFDTASKNNASMFFSWADRGTPIENPTQGADITIINPGMSLTQRLQINVEANHANHLLQSARNGFTLTMIGNENLNQEINQNEITVF